MVHNVEDKTRKELVEIVKIQMEEYQLLLERAETAERERDGIMNSFLQLKGESYSCTQCGNEVECKHFDIFNGAIVEGLLNEFAIEQQIKVISSAKLKSYDTSRGLVVSVEDLECLIAQLRRQLNGGK